MNEEVDVMAEEIGLSVIGGGDLLFLEGVDPVVNRKAELRAKLYAYNLVLPVKDLVKSLKSLMAINEIADAYCVTPCFVKEAIVSYQVKWLFN